MDQAVAAAERHVSAFNRHDLEAHSANETEDIDWTQPGVSIAGREAVAALQQALWTAFPDARIDVVRRVASADAVITEEVLTGTQTGPFVTPAGTLPPSGRAIRIPFVTVQQVRDRKIAVGGSTSTSWTFSVSLALRLAAVPADRLTWRSAGTARLASSSRQAEALGPGVADRTTSPRVAPAVEHDAINLDPTSRQPFIRRNVGEASV